MSYICIINYRVQLTKKINVKLKKIFILTQLFFYKRVIHCGMGTTYFKGVN